MRPAQIAREIRAHEVRPARHPQASMRPAQIAREIFPLVLSKDTKVELQ